MQEPEVDLPKVLFLFNHRVIDMKYRNVEMEFYHGTCDAFDMKEILPPIETGNQREEWRKKLTNKVFFTNSLLSAENYAKKAAAKYNGKAVVYRVRPIGEVWHVNTNEYVADKALIIGRVL